MSFLENAVVLPAQVEPIVYLLYSITFLLTISRTVQLDTTILKTYGFKDVFHPSNNSYTRDDFNLNNIRAPIMRLYAMNVMLWIASIYSQSGVSNALYPFVFYSFFAIFPVVYFSTLLTGRVGAVLSTFPICCINIPLLNTIPEYYDVPSSHLNIITSYFVAFAVLDVIVLTPYPFLFISFLRDQSNQKKSNIERQNRLYEQYSRNDFDISLTDYIHNQDLVINKGDTISYLVMRLYLSLKANTLSSQDLEYILTLYEKIIPDIICKKAKENYRVLLNRWSTGDNKNISLFRFAAELFPDYYGSVDNREESISDGYKDILLQQIVTDTNSYRAETNQGLNQLSNKVNSIFEIVNRIANPNEQSTPMDKSKIIIEDGASFTGNIFDLCGERAQGKAPHAAEGSE